MRLTLLRPAAAMLLIIAVGAAATGLLHQARTTLAEDRRATAVASQQTNAALTGQYLQQTLIEAQTLAARIDTTGREGHTRTLLRDLLVGRTGHFNAAAEVLDLDGARVATYVRREQVTVTDHTTFQEAFAAAATGQAAISDLGVVDGEPYVAVAVPASRPNGHIDGVLVGYIHTPTSALQRYSAQLAGDGATGGIVDRTGTLVTARNPHNIGNTITDAPHGDARAEQQPVGGVATVTVAAPVTAVGWALVEQQPASVFYGPAARKSYQSQLLLLAALIAAAAFSVWHLHQRHVDRHRATARYQAVVADASDAIFVTDPAGTITFTNPAAAHLTGRDDLLGTAIGDLAHPDDIRTFVTALTVASYGESSRGQLRIPHNDGTDRICDVTVSSSDPIDGLIVTLRDVTDLTDAIGRLAHQADHDHLTGLPNRAALTRRLDDVLTRTGQQPAVMFIDLDGFKQVNDTHGHDIGDELLIAVAGRLSACLRGNDTLGRQGGDEFVALLDGTVDPDAASHVAARMIDRLSEPFATSAGTCHIGASIGIAFADEASTADTLLRAADTLMYQAKQLGRGRYATA